MDETQTLAAFTANTELDDVDPEAIDHAKRAIADYVGVALYGSQHDVGEQVFSYVQRNSAGTTSTVFGHGTASPPGAALANGAFGHAIDYDDTFESIVLHPTAPVFGATLAAAEINDVSGADALGAYTVGCEAAFRIGHALYPDHYEHGWHNTGTVGTFGAAAAAASVLNLDPEAVQHAFGIAASESSSLKKNFGSMTKPLHAGHAAEMGLRAVLLANHGFTADDAVFEGKIGYGEVMTANGDYDPTEITDQLGEAWAVTDIGFKPYPSGVITHAAMDALRQIVVENDLHPDDVEQITVTLDDAASEMLIHANPADALQAKFSIEFCLAAVLRERDAGINEFTDEYVNKPATRQQMEKVERDFEEQLFGDEFAGYGSRVIVKTVDNEYTAEEKSAPGSPTNPIDDTRLEAKFTECAAVLLDEEEATELSNMIRSLDDIDSVAELTSMLR